MAMDGLLGSSNVKRIAGFQNSELKHGQPRQTFLIHAAMEGAFKLWAPRLHEYYRDTLEQLHSHHPHLRQNFQNSVFAVATANHQ